VCKTRRESNRQNKILQRINAEYDRKLQNAEQAQMESKERCTGRHKQSIELSIGLTKNAQKTGRIDVHKQSIELSIG